ncbi:MAG: hypothetical protein HXY40_14935 [Chloroflexi bacterium]|nr:hypothetical protein [Chloroflexota bacterium]
MNAYRRFDRLTLARQQPKTRRRQQRRARATVPDSRRGKRIAQKTAKRGADTCAYV